LEFKLCPLYVKKNFKNQVIYFHKLNQLQQLFEVCGDLKTKIKNKQFILKEFENSREKLQKVYQIEGNKIGDKYYKLDYSKKDSLSDVSKAIHEQTNKFIFDIIEDKKKYDPLITEKDESYNLLVRYNSERQELLMNENYKTRTRKFIIFFIIILVIILIIIIILFNYN